VIEHNKKDTAELSQQGGREGRWGGGGVCTLSKSNPEVQVEDVERVSDEFYRCYMQRCAWADTTRQRDSSGIRHSLLTLYMNCVSA
jgi:hypothetical protein